MKIRPLFILFIQLSLVWAYVAADGAPQNSNTWHILLSPHLASIVLAGASLGLATLLLQTSTKNPLLSSSVLGISTGGQIAFLASLLFASSLVYNTIFWVLSGCAIGALITLLVAKGLKKEPQHLLLAGMINNILLALILFALLYFKNQELSSIDIWKASGLYQDDWQVIYATLPLALIALTMLSGKFSKQVFSNAIDTNKVEKSILLISAIILTAVGITLIGPIALVGLISAFIVKALGFDTLKKQLIASVLSGIIILLVADIMVHAVAGYTQLPIGLMTSIIGAPLFINLISNYQKTFPTHAHSHDASLLLNAKPIGVWLSTVLVSLVLFAQFYTVGA